jgi:hypothetical protein
MASTPVLKGVVVQSISCPSGYTGTVFENDDKSPNPVITILGTLIALRFLLQPWEKAWTTELESKIQNSLRLDLGFAPEHRSDPYSTSRKIQWYGPDYPLHRPGSHYIPPRSESVFALPLSKSAGNYRSLLLRKLDGTAFFERIGFVILDSTLTFSLLETFPPSSINLI